MRNSIAIPLFCASLIYSSAGWSVQPMVAGGDSHSLALNSSGRVLAWGDNAFGQLGSGAALVQRTPVEIAGLANIMAVAGGDVHSFALASNGTVSAWGFNGQGQLGDGTTVQKSAPAQVLTSDLSSGAVAGATVALSGVIAIASGINHGIGLKSDGTVWAWGQNTYGQVGNNTNTNSLLSTQVLGLSGMSMIAIAAGSNHNLALRSDGTVWSWGLDTSGQLGDGKTTNLKVATQVPGLSGVVAVAAGASHSLALKNDGTVWSWGLNTSGQLGDTTNTLRKSPVQVSGLSGIFDIAAGGDHSLALRADGTVWAWGANSVGQLGDNTTTNRLTPQIVSSLSNVTDIAAGGYHSLAIKNDSTVWTWGNNWYGQLGEFTDTLVSERHVPVQVAAVGGSGALKLDTTLTATSQLVTVAEFYNSNLNHYFMTADTSEANGIDSGQAGPGWIRTGLSFLAWNGQSVTTDVVPVCRFYGTPGKGPNSHFYTADSGECNQVKADPGWYYEGVAFYNKLPQNGNCPSGYPPIYRVYNNRAAANDANHRFITSKPDYDKMVAAGWLGEGIVMCAPSWSQ